MEAVLPFNHPQAAKLAKLTRYEILDKDGNRNPKEGRALAVFATQPIPLGTRILAEVPLLRLDRIYDNAALVDAIQSLTHTAKASLLSLSAFDPDLDALIARSRHADMPLEIEETARLLSVARHHGIELYTSRTGTKLVVCRDYSCISHSCVPNAYSTFNSALGALTVHAIRDIRAGEKISVSRVKLTKGREERQAELRARFGFQCACEACGRGWLVHSAARGLERSEELQGRRSEICRLDLDLDFWARSRVFEQVKMEGPLGKSLVNSAGVEDPLGAIKVLGRKMEMEGLLGDELALWYNNAEIWAEMAEKGSKAVGRWETKGLELRRVLEGEDHPDVVERMERSG